MITSQYPQLQYITTSPPMYLPNPPIYSSPLSLPAQYSSPPPQQSYAMQPYSTQVGLSPVQLIPSFDQSHVTTTYSVSPSYRVGSQLTAQYPKPPVYSSAQPSPQRGSPSPPPPTRPLTEGTPTTHATFEPTFAQPSNGYYSEDAAYAVFFLLVGMFCVPLFLLFNCYYWYSPDRIARVWAKISAIVFVLYLCAAIVVVIVLSVTNSWR